MIKDEINKYLVELGLYGFENNVSLSLTKNSNNGEVSTNIAMIASKNSSFSSMELALKIIDKIKENEYIQSIKVTKPGFINITFLPIFWHNQLHDILNKGIDYGKFNYGKEQNVIIEFVSANPTGPLHIAHVRGAVFGDVLANLLKYVGYNVSKEYYINDYGEQIIGLTDSVYYRYCELLKLKENKIPKNFYPGEYIVEIAKQFIIQYNDKYLNTSKDIWFPIIRSFSLCKIMNIIKQDLKNLDIKIDVFSSEKEIVQKNIINKTIEKLKNKDLIYKGTLSLPPKGIINDDWEPTEQILFRSTNFGDDIDRVIQKTNKNFTYFANDIGYHWDKLNRVGKNGLLINVWGADHSGYIKRIESAVAALTKRKKAIEIETCQTLNIFMNEKYVKTSKRDGNFVLVSDFLKNVDKDVLRFFMLTRKNNQPIDFDCDKVKEQSRDNLVFYVQYAHARACSVLRKSKYAIDKKINLSLLKDKSEIEIIRILCSYKDVIEKSVIHREPHRITNFLYELSSSFHSFWNKGIKDPNFRFIIEDNEELTKSRLVLIECIKIIIQSGLKILGVKPLESI